MTSARRADLSTLALAVTLVLWASAFVGIRDAGASFGPGELTLGRLIVGGLALTLIARPWRHRMPRGRPLHLLLVAGVFWFGAYNLALNAGELYVDAGTAALVVNTGPILIALFAGLLLGEGFPKPLIAGIAIAFAGVALIAVGSGGTAVSERPALGVLLCFGAAATYAIGVLTQKPALATVDPSYSVWFACWVGAVICLPWAPSLIDQLRDAPAEHVAWLLYLAIFPTAVGFSTWSYALKHLSAGQTSSATYLVPAIAIAISWVMLDEIPAALGFVGGALCLVGVWVTRRKPTVAIPAAR